MSGVQFPAGTEIFSHCSYVQICPGNLSSGYWGDLSSGVKQLRCEGDHSPPSSAKVKDASSYTSTPSHIILAFCFVEHRQWLLSVVLS